MEQSEIIKEYMPDFEEMYEIIRSMIVSNKQGVYRIDLLSCQVEEQTRYKPRLYKQETVMIQRKYDYEKTVSDNEVVADGSTYTSHINWHPKPSELLIWREYEMGFSLHDDPEVAFRLAFVSIKSNNGR